ncbi:hypothetical protein [Methylobacterium sp. B1]|uniref:hypothetical protein n=1 Tax=Methylobacterium sp. B1 TaxID=91459 RepID=UPI0005B84063|nr:hypothetical protein [Methylobacterium sp. B1]
MSDQEIHIRVRQVPTIPPFLALVLVMMICGIVAAIFKFIGENIVELTSFVFVPLIVWFAYGRRMRRKGLLIHAVVGTMGSGLLTLAAFQTYAWHQNNLRAAERAAWLKKYEEEAPIREERYKQACIDGIGYLKIGQDASAFTLDYCVKYFTPQQTADICQSLAKRPPITRYGWKTCNAPSGGQAPQHLH